jgi:hypoxanthine phosphoribosyltransferase
MSEKIRVMLPEEDLDKRIRELGEEISKDYAGKTVYLVCILKGAAVFAMELAKRITTDVVIDFMATSSYGSGTVSSGVVKIKKDLDLDPTGQNVIIVEDIIDSGNTLNYLGQLFKDEIGALQTVLKADTRHFLVDQADDVVFDLADDLIYAAVVVVEGLAVDVGFCGDIADGDIVDVFLGKELCEGFLDSALGLDDSAVDMGCFLHIVTSNEREMFVKRGIFDRSYPEMVDMCII